MAQTKDFVDVAIDLSYCVSFLPEYKEKWFCVENYVQYLCERQRSLIKKAIKNYTIEEFYANSTDIIRKVALAKSNETTDKKVKLPAGRFFAENGMLVHDTDVLQVSVERKVAVILEENQTKMINRCLELSNAEKKAAMQAKLAEYERKEIELHNANKQHKMALERQLELEQLEYKATLEEKARVQKEAATKAEADLQPILDAIQAAKLARDKKEDEARIATEKALADLEKEKQKAYADTVAEIMKSVSPDLVAALTATANADMLETVTQSVAPYAMARGESVADFTNTLLRGTTLENVVDNLTGCKID